MKTPLFIGLAFWVAGTLAIRAAGRGLLQPERPVRTLVLYAASFVAMAFLIPGVCGLLGLNRTFWFEATALLILPTLLLDSLSCAFFPRVFPSVDAGAAGIFGGWMLVCCAGAVVGVWVRVWMLA